MRPTAIIFTGLQATGKSTFYAQHFADTHVRINLDMLKTRHREKLLIEACLATQQPFVVDNTNPAAADRLRYMSLLAGRDYSVTCYYFQSKMADSLARNALRAEGKRIPDTGIKGTSARLELPSFAEGYDELYYVEMSGQNTFSVQAWQP